MEVCIVFSLFLRSIYSVFYTNQGITDYTEYLRWNHGISARETYCVCQLKLQGLLNGLQLHTLRPKQHNDCIPALLLCSLIIYHLYWLFQHWSLCPSTYWGKFVLAFSLAPDNRSSNLTCVSLATMKKVKVLSMHFTTLRALSSHYHLMAHLFAVNIHLPDPNDSNSCGRSAAVQSIRCHSWLHLRLLRQYNNSSILHISSVYPPCRWSLRQTFREAPFWPKVMLSWTRIAYLQWPTQYSCSLRSNHSQSPKFLAICTV